MQFMSMVKFSEVQLAPPPKAFLEAMDRLIQESAKAGCVMVEAGGLLPTANGARVRLSSGKVTVMDGPFTEAKEVIGGYAIFDVPIEGRNDRMHQALHGPASNAFAGLGGRSRNSPGRGSG